MLNMEVPKTAAAAAAAETILCSHVPQKYKEVAGLLSLRPQGSETGLGGRRSY